MEAVNCSDKQVDSDTAVHTEKGDMTGHFQILESWDIHNLHNFVQKLLCRLPGETFDRLSLHLLSSRESLICSCITSIAQIFNIV